MSDADLVVAIVEEVRLAFPKGLSLDELAEHLLHKPVGYAEIEAIIGALEDAGVPLDVPPAAVNNRAHNLGPVLTAARAWTAEHGKPPSVHELASHVGMTEDEVRQALEFGRAPGR